MMPRVIQPSGSGGEMRMRYTAHRKRGLVAALKNMQAEGMTLRALRVSVANLSRWALQGVGKIDHLDKIHMSKGGIDWYGQPVEGDRRYTLICPPGRKWQPLSYPPPRQKNNPKSP